MTERSKRIAVVVFATATVVAGLSMIVPKRQSWSAVCRNGDLSYSRHRSGTCSGKGGVRYWRGEEPKGFVPKPTPEEEATPAPLPVTNAPGDALKVEEK